VKSEGALRVVAGVNIRRLAAPLAGVATGTGVVGPLASPGPGRVAAGVAAGVVSEDSTILSHGRGQAKSRFVWPFASRNTNDRRRSLQYRRTRASLLREVRGCEVDAGDVARAAHVTRAASTTALVTSVVHYVS